MPLEDLPIECLAVEVARPRTYAPAAVRASFVVRHCTGEPMVRPLRAEQIEVINGETGAPFDASLEGGGASGPARLSDLLAERPGAAGTPTVALYAVLSLDLSNSITDSGSAAGVIAAAQGFVDALVRDAAPDYRYQVAIQIFGRDQATRVVRPFTDDYALLTAALQGLADQPGLGTTNLYGAYRSALEVLAAQRGGADIVQRTLVIVTDGRHEAGDFENQRRLALAERDAAAAQGIEVYSVAINSPADDLPFLAELATAPSFFDAAAAVEQLRAAFERTAERLRRLPEATYVVGICTPVELGTPTFEVAVTVEGVRAVGAGTYNTQALNGDVAACDPERVAEPCGAAVCGDSYLPGLECGACAEGETCEAEGRCACVPEVTAEGRCGLNGRGTRSHTCGPEGWLPWSECADPDVCADHTRGEAPCADGTTVPRRCLAGQWQAEANCPCAAADASAPCNGCPAGTVVPLGFVCAPAGDYIRAVGEHNAHAVTLSRSLFVQATEAVQAEWSLLMDEDPSFNQGCDGQCPVDRVTWFGAIAYANARSVAEGLAPCYAEDGGLVGGATPYDCAGYRLPTEAEWEYAQRAGTQTRFYWGDDAQLAEVHAWYSGNAGRNTHRVATKLPNAWGLYDMSGNVWEWVHDWWAEYPPGPLTDPWGPAEGGQFGRVRRGGSWNDRTPDLEGSHRYSAPPNNRDNINGFRLVRTAPR